AWVTPADARLASSRWSDATGRAFHPQGSCGRFPSASLHLILLPQALLGAITSTDGPNRPGSHRTTPQNRTYSDGQRELGPDPGSALCRSPGRGRPPPAARRCRGKTLAAWPLSLAGASAASAGECVRPGSRPPRPELDVHGNGPYREQPTGGGSGL